MKKQKHNSSAGKKAESKKTKSRSERERRLRRLGCYALIVLVVLLFFLLIFRDFVIRKTAEAVASKMIGVEVSIEELDTSVLHGSIRISNLKIANPPGFDEPYMLQLEYLFADVDWGTVFSQTKIIESIHVSGLSACGAIRNDGKLNLGVINDYVQRRAAESQEEPPAEKETDRKKSMVLRELLVENSSAALREDSTDFLLRVPIDCEKQDIVLYRDDRSFAEIVNDYTALVQAWCNGSLHASGALIDTGKSIINQGTDAGKSFTTPVVDFFKNTFPALNK